MKKITIILLLLFFAKITYAQNNSEVANAIKSISANLQKHKSISFDINYKAKHLYGKDYEHFKGKVEIVRYENDNNFGCHFWYNVNDTLTKYYDGNKAYTINSKANTITYSDLTNGQLDMILQEIDADFLRIPFIVPRSLEGLIGNQTSLKLTNYKSIKDAKNIHVLYKQESKVSDAAMDLVYNTKTFDILRIFSTVKFNNETQTNEWVFSNTVYDKVNEKDWKAKFDKLKIGKKFIKFVKPEQQLIDKQPDFNK